MKQLLALAVLGTFGCATPGPEPTDEAPPLQEELPAVVVEEPPAAAEPINATCPRSGKPVVADSLTEYRGYVVGFCNTHCRDDFAANVDERPNDTSFFDAAIVALEERSPH